MVNSLGQRTLGPTRIIITVAETCSSQMSTATCRRQWQTTAVPAKTNHGMYEVLRRGKTERKLINRIRAGQMSFLGHIMRKHGLENIVVTGKIEGERSRGRPRLNFMKSLSQLLKISEVEIIERTRNREEWRTMTANVRIGYGT